MTSLKLTICLCLLLLAVGARADATWPTRVWPYSTPQTQGLDQVVLGELAQDMASGQMGLVDDFLVIRHGFIVLERHFEHDYQSLALKHPKYDTTSGPYNYQHPSWHPYHGDGSPHTLQSVTKSVTSALVGIALYRGELPNLEVKTFQNSLTLEHLLNMTSGIRWNEESEYGEVDNDWSNMEKSQDWAAYTRSRGFEHTPGTHFNYNSGATMLVAQALKEATGQHIDSYTQEFLFAPLGITTSYWKKSPTGLPDAQGGLYLHPRDLAKIGLLYLRDGIWEGERLFPLGWVRRSMTPVEAENLEDWKYGLGWWLLPCQQGTAYVGLGYGGQKIILLPQSDVIVVTTGWNLFGHKAMSTSELLRRVESAVQK